MSSFDHLVLDADETVFLLKETVGTTYSRIAASHGVSLAPEALDGRLAPLWSELKSTYLRTADGHKTSPELEREFWKVFASRLCEIDLSHPGFSNFFDEVYRYYGKAESRTLADSAVEFFTLVQQSGTKISLVSNNDSRLLSLCSEFELKQFLSGIFPSDVLGVKKPSAEFFRSVERALGAEGKTFLYIGDDIELDYFPAISVGWSSILLLARGRMPDSVPCVRSFGELITLMSEE